MNPEHNQNTEPIPEVKENISFDENKLVAGTSMLLDSLESGLSALALTSIEASGMSYSEFRSLLSKIPNAGRDTIGRYSDFIEGKRSVGIGENTLAEALDAQLESLVAGGVDLENVRQRMETVHIPRYVLNGMFTAL